MRVCASNEYCDGNAALIREVVETPSISRGQIYPQRDLEQESLSRVARTNDCLCMKLVKYVCLKIP